MKKFFAALSLLLFIVTSAAAQNQISIENQNPGAPRSEWDLAAPGSSNIEGFATEISVNHGSTVNFKISTSSTNWRIDIYRLGYYQGNGARFLDRIVKTTAAPQPAPIVDTTTGLVDAGNWSITASWAVPASAVSGVYIAHLVDQNDTTIENHIPFIVRADESTSDILFQTSDTTWHAYNGWGGANLYGGNGPGRDSAPGRAYKVSYNRPICTRNGPTCGTYADTHDYLFSAEYAAIYWLERNGYDVSYAAGVDVSRYPAMLLQHKVFTSTGHDEYWDGVARANVEAARSAGKHLLFMSGNEVYWKTRWEPSIDGSATPYKTLVCYKETRANRPIDPLDASPTWTWTGTWRDPRNSPPADGGRPENGLTGTMFSVDSYRSDAIQVPYSMSRLRFWRNTAVANAATGATTTLTQNILGYEWDSKPDNRFAPSGAIDLSETTLSVNSLLLDYGSRTGSGQATHNLSLYKDPANGSIIFGAGTVFWAWGLSNIHDGPPTPVDVNIQQATINVLADMGAQPATLQPGLQPATASTDVTPPASTITTPLPGAVFAEGQPIQIAGSASDTGGRVAGVEVSVDGGQTWRKASGTTSWTFGWNATAGASVIRSRATDDSLNTETPGTGVSVSATSGGQTLFGSIQIPENRTESDPHSVELGVQFTPAASGVVKGIRFWKNGINVAPHLVSLWNSNGSLLRQATSINETPTGWQTVLFASAYPVTQGVTYTASYHSDGFYTSTQGYFSTPLTSGLLSAPINAGVYRYNSTPVFPDLLYQSENYWVDVLFEQVAPTSPPVITSATTATATVGSPFSYQITATNSPASFGVAQLPPGLSVDSQSGQITGTPTATGTFNITLSASNAIGTGTAPLALTISAPTPSYSLFSLSNTPAVITNSDTQSVELGVKFFSASSGAITGMRFYKSPQNVGTHTATLWSASGAQLGTATFTNETASGWQTVNFTTPIQIAANTTYVASYHANGGRYSTTANYFATARTNGPLTAPASASSGGNGVYRYGASRLFPTSTFNANNYWVDVIFAPTAAPVLQEPLTASGALGAPFTYQITASNNPTSFGATPLPAGLSINTSTGVISGTPTQDGVFDVTISATNASGAGTATLSLNILTAPAITSAVTATGSTGEPFAYQIIATNKPTSFGASPLPAGLSIDTSTGLISGTPTQTGLTNVTLTATNAVGSGSATLALTIGAAPSITSILTANGVVGTPFSYTIAASNNPTSFSAAPLPPGLSIDTSTGVISGTPTQGGAFNVTLGATNATGTGSATLALTIAAPPAINSALTAAGSVGASFNYQITATNNPTNYSAAPLPPGLSVDTSTGTISGTPTQDGEFNITIGATNAAGSDSKTLVVTISAPPAITSELSASGVVGTPFTYQIMASNTPTSYSATPLPPGLSFNSSTGAISGTPTQGGAFNVMIGATNAAGTGSATLVVTIAAAPSINSALAAGGGVGTPFTYEITASNNPASFSATPLPPGLGFNPTTGVISGTPTQEGVFNITIGATNAIGTDFATLVVTIAGPPSINSPLAANGAVGHPFAYQITATNNPTAYSAAPLPSGLLLNATTGAITGMPTEAGTFNVLVSATNNAGTGSATLVLTVTEPPAITSTLTASGAVGAPFAYQITATNNPTSYSATPLPPGLSIDTTTGVISGVPTQGGGFSVMIGATNADGTGSASLALSIAAPPSITSPQTASGVAGSSFAYQITATGSPTIYGSTALPAGLIIDTSTGLISGTPTATGTFSVTLSATNAVGTGIAPLSINIAAPPPITLFSSSDVPSVISGSDRNSVELGMKFTSTTPGAITGMRFYKGSLNTGTHTAHIWSAGGVLLASATFTGETASGWQTVAFSTPLQIAANTTYVASYHSNGRYSYTNNYFSTSRVSGPLTAPSSASSGGNGVYAYGTATVFPTNTFSATNYWVDVIFAPSFQ